MAADALERSPSPTGTIIIHPSPPSSPPLPLLHSASASASRSRSWTSHESRPIPPSPQSNSNPTSKSSPLPARTQAVLHGMDDMLADLERAREKRKQEIDSRSVLSCPRLPEATPDENGHDDDLYERGGEKIVGKAKIELTGGEGHRDSYYSALDLEQPLEAPSQPFVSSRPSSPPQSHYSADLRVPRPQPRLQSPSSPSRYPLASRTSSFQSLPTSSQNRATPTRTSPLKPSALDVPFATDPSSPRPASEGASSQPSSPSCAPSPSLSAIKFLQSSSASEYEYGFIPSSPIAPSEPARPKSTPPREEGQSAFERPRDHQAITSWTPGRQPNAIVATTVLFGHRMGTSLSMGCPSTPAPPPLPTRSEKVFTTATPDSHLKSSSFQDRLRTFQSQSASQSTPTPARVSQLPVTQKPTTPAPPRQPVPYPSNTDSALEDLSPISAVTLGRRAPWVKPYDPTEESFFTDEENGLVDKRELTTVDERTERDTLSSGSRIWKSRSHGSLMGDSAKPLPCTPNKENSATTSPYYRPAATHAPLVTPSPSKLGKASGLIAFFEKTSGKGGPSSVPMQRSGGVGFGDVLKLPTIPSGHSRGLRDPMTFGSGSGLSQDQSRSSSKNGNERVVQIPASRFEADVPMTPPPPFTSPPIPLHATLFNPVAGPPLPPRPIIQPSPSPSCSRSRKSSMSPVLGVRNVVAAWRGRLASGSQASQDVVSLARGDSIKSIANKQKDKNVFEDAFFTIRRMSTKRRNRKLSLVSQAEEEQSVPPPQGDQGRHAVLDAQPVETMSQNVMPAPQSPGLSLPTRQPRTATARGRVVSRYTEMSYEPQRIGQVWYLNVHDVGRPYTWIKCDAQLYDDHLVLTWLPSGSRDSRGVITLDLVHCQEVRSIPSPNHRDAQEDIGSIAARDTPGLCENLFPFQLVYDDGIERLGSDTARDRVRWVSAIWDVLEQAPEQQVAAIPPESSLSGNTDRGSISTHFRPPAPLDWQASSQQDHQEGQPDTGSTEALFARPQPFYGGGRTVDDSMIEASGVGMLSSLSRQGSRRIDRSMGSMLRRIASEADVDLSSLIQLSVNERRAEEEAEDSPPPTRVRQMSNVSRDYKAARQPVDTFINDFMNLPTPRPATAPFKTAADPIRNGDYGFYLRTGAISPGRSTQRCELREESTYHPVDRVTTVQSTTSRPLSWYTAQHSPSELSMCSSRASLLSRLHARTETPQSTEFHTVNSGPSALVRRPVMRRRSQSHGGPISGPRSRLALSSLEERTGSYFTAEHYPAAAQTRSTAASSNDHTASTFFRTPTGFPPSIPSPSSGNPFTASSNSPIRSGVWRGTPSAPQSIHSTVPSVVASSPSHAAPSIFGHSGTIAWSLPSIPNLAKSVTASSDYHAASHVLKPPTSMTSSPAPSTSDNSSKGTSKKSKRKPVPQVDWPISARSQSPTITGKSWITDIDHRAEGRHVQVMRTLRDQEASRLTNADHVGGQLNRIEQSLADMSTYFAIKPPPVPQKDAAGNDPSEPSSDSSSDSGSDASTSRPSTPPTLPVRGDLVKIQDTLDDLVTQQGRLQQWMEEAVQRKDPPKIDRLEDLLLRLLIRSGDSEIEMEMGLDRAGRQCPSICPANTIVSTTYDDETSSLLSDEAGIRAPARPSSMQTVSERHPHSGVPSSLLAPSVSLSDRMSEDWERDNLPTPSPTFRSPGIRALAPQFPRTVARPALPDEQYEYYPREQDFVEEGHQTPEIRSAMPTPLRSPATPSSLPRTPRIIESSPPSSVSFNSTLTPPSPRRPFRAGPVPQPLGLPSPVHGNLPPPPMMMPPMPPFLPPMGPTLVRPTRLAPPREPITTTYFRRGFPPGMPPPMMGPHLGPYHGGVAPGAPGFGGPFGPNVVPRPGYPPLGAAGGDYGLRRRPFFPQRPPPTDGERSEAPSYSEDSYSEYSSSYPSAVPVTPVDGHIHEIHHEVPMSAGNEDALVRAQGEQQNEIGRYLSDLGSAMDAGREEQRKELETLHEDIGRIRDQLNNPTRPSSMVKELPAIPTVVPVAAESTTATPGPQMATMNISEHSHDSPIIVDKVLPLVTDKDSDQDRLLRDLQNRVSDLVRRLDAPRDHGLTYLAPISEHPPTVVGSTGVRFAPEHIKETTTEIIRGPGTPETRREVVREFDLDRLHDDPPIREIITETQEFRGPPPVQESNMNNTGSGALKDSRGGSIPDRERIFTTETHQDPRSGSVLGISSHPGILEYAAGTRYDHTSELSRPGTYAGSVQIQPLIVGMANVPAAAGTRPGTTLGDQPGASEVPSSHHPPKIVFADSIGTHVPHQGTVHGEPSNYGPLQTILGNQPNGAPTIITTAPTRFQPSKTDRPITVVGDPDDQVLGNMANVPTANSIGRERPVHPSAAPVVTSTPPLVVSHNVPLGKGAGIVLDELYADGTTVPGTKMPKAPPSTFTHKDSKAPTVVSGGHAEPQKVANVPSNGQYVGGQPTMSRIETADGPSPYHDQMQDGTAHNVGSRPAVDDEFHAPGSVEHNRPPVGTSGSVAPGSVAHTSHPISQSDMDVGNQPNKLHNKPSHPAFRDAPKEVIEIPTGTGPAPTVIQTRSDAMHNAINVPHNGNGSVGRPMTDVVGGRSPPVAGRNHNIGSKSDSVVHTSGSVGGAPSTYGDGPHRGIGQHHLPHGSILAGSQHHDIVDHDESRHQADERGEQFGGDAPPIPNKLKKKGSRVPSSSGRTPLQKSVAPSQYSANGEPVRGLQDGREPPGEHSEGGKGTITSRLGSGSVVHIVGHSKDGLPPSSLGKKEVDSEESNAHRERAQAATKAKKEDAENARLEEERIKKEREETAGLAADRHKEYSEQLAAIRKALEDQKADDSKFKMTYADVVKGKENRRPDKASRDKMVQDALDKLIAEKEADKKWRELESKKPGVQVIIDYLKKSGDDQSAFLRSLAADIVAQNANQHQLTQAAAAKWAKEQVGYNLSGYLDDFSKSLASEVRPLLREVGDLREMRRAIQYEIADLCLFKGRQSSGDLMAVMPWPGGSAPGKPPGAVPPAAPPKPKPEEPKPPGPPPSAWQTYSLPPSMGGPGIKASGPPGPRPPPSNGGSRPLPVPAD